MVRDDEACGDCVEWMNARNAALIKAGLVDTFG
jgi:hypothetical protein